MAGRRSRPPGRAHPVGRRTVSRPPYAAALLRRGHRRGIVGPRGVLRDGFGRGRPRRGGPGPRRLRAHGEIGGRPGPAGVARRHRPRNGPLSPPSRRHAAAWRGGGGAAHAVIRGPGLSATNASARSYGGPGMFPYVEEQFTADEEAILRRYVTNLHLPVFALVNLPEVVKGALFARYSRSPKSLRRLFLAEFVRDLDITGDISLDATIGLARAEQLYEKV